MPSNNKAAPNMAQRDFTPFISAAREKWLVNRSDERGIPHLPWLYVPYVLKEI
jgi:hypothetical protein